MKKAVVKTGALMRRSVTAPSGKSTNIVPLSQRSASLSRDQPYWAKELWKGDTAPQREYRGNESFRTQSAVRNYSERYAHMSLTQPSAPITRYQPYWANQIAKAAEKKNQGYGTISKTEKEPRYLERIKRNMRLLDSRRRDLSKHVEEADGSKPRSKTCDPNHLRRSAHQYEGRNDVEHSHEQGPLQAPVASTTDEWRCMYRMASRHVDKKAQLKAHSSSRNPPTRVQSQSPDSPLKLRKKRSATNLHSSLASRSAGRSTHRYEARQRYSPPNSTPTRRPAYREQSQSPVATFRSGQRQTRQSRYEQTYRDSPSTQWERAHHARNDAVMDEINNPDQHGRGNINRKSRRDGSSMRVRDLSSSHAERSGLRADEVHRQYDRSASARRRNYRRYEQSSHGDVSQRRHHHDWHSAASCSRYARSHVEYGRQTSWEPRIPQRDSTYYGSFSGGKGAAVDGLNRYEADKRALALARARIECSAQLFNEQVMESSRPETPRGRSVHRRLSDQHEQSVSGAEHRRQRDRDDSNARLRPPCDQSVAKAEHRRQRDRDDNDTHSLTSAYKGSEGQGAQVVADGRKASVRVDHTDHGDNDGHRKHDEGGDILVRSHSESRICDANWWRKHHPQGATFQAETPKHTDDAAPTNSLLWNRSTQQSLNSDIQKIEGMDKGKKGSLKQRITANRVRLEVAFKKLDTERKQATLPAYRSSIRKTPNMDIPSAPVSTPEDYSLRRQSVHTGQKVATPKAFDFTKCDTKHLPQFPNEAPRNSNCQTKPNEWCIELKERESLADLLPRCKQIHTQSGQLFELDALENRAELSSTAQDDIKDEAEHEHNVTGREDFMEESDNSAGPADAFDGTENSNDRQDSV